MPDPHRHADKRNLVESILNYIPGFHGYLQKEYRRESDHLARTWLVERLRDGRRGLDDYQRALVDAGNLDGMNACERIRSRLDTVINQIDSAVRGYSGFFDYVRVNEEMLDRVYDLDMGLMEEVKALAEKMQQLQHEASSSVSEATSPILQGVDEIREKFAKRNELLQGIGE